MRLQKFRQAHLLRIVSVVTIVLTITVPADVVWGMEELDLVLKIRELRLSCTAAADSTRAHLLRRFTQDTFGQEVSVSSAIVQGFGTTYTLQSEPRGGGMILNSKWYLEPVDWTYQGCYQSVPIQRSQTVSVYQKAGLLSEYPRRVDISYRPPEASSIRVVKEHQDVTLSLNLLAPSERTLLDLRAGQKIAFACYLLQVNDDGSGTCILRSLKPEVTMLRCDNGHEYAPSSGYRFCPQCGHPLQ